MRTIWIALAACLAWPGLAAEPAKNDLPMASKMKKPGMKQGDVRKNAEAKMKKMKPMLEQESQSMDRAKP